MNENYASDYEVRLATLGAMSGDTSVHYDSVYDIDLKILEKVQEGGGGGEPAEYLKNASVSGNTLTLTKKDGSTVEFTPEGGGDKTIIVLTEDRTQEEWKAIYDNITPKIAAKEDLSDYLFVYKNGTHYCEAIDVHYAEDNWLIFTFIKYGFENPQQYFRYDIMSNGECYTEENKVYSVEEAPEDGKTYGRQNANWVKVTEEAPNNGKTYGRKNANWVEIQTGGTTAQNYDITYDLSTVTDLKEGKIVNVLGGVETHTIDGYAVNCIIANTGQNPGSLWWVDAIDYQDGKFVVNRNGDDYYFCWYDGNISGDWMQVTKSEFEEGVDIATGYYDVRGLHTCFLSSFNFDYEDLDAGFTVEFQLFKSEPDENLVVHTENISEDEKYQIISAEEWEPYTYQYTEKKENKGLFEYSDGKWWWKDVNLNAFTQSELAAYYTQLYGGGRDFCYKNIELHSPKISYKDTYANCRNGVISCRNDENDLLIFFQAAPSEYGKYPTNIVTKLKQDGTLERVESYDFAKEKEKMPEYIGIDTSGNIDSSHNSIYWVSRVYFTNNYYFSPEQNAGMSVICENNGRKFYGNIISWDITNDDASNLIFTIMISLSDGTYIGRYRCSGWIVVEKLNWQKIVYFN